MGNPIAHDVFVRDGFLLTCLWHDGLSIWDIGGGGRGGSVTNPVLLGNVKTANGSVHNVWWFHDPVTGSTRYAFVGEEGSPFTTGVVSSGRIHVVDLIDPTRPKEVAQFGLPGAGPHNLSMDEPSGILYSAYYNAGVVALDVRGDLGACQATERTNALCDLRKMGRLLAQGLVGGPPVFVWGVRYDGTAVHASDMLNGVWKLAPFRR